ncbi:MAG: prepilin-type N-terminal cleavage/methylation domain-containing protein, partial [Bacilli bacterium]|nr:prepilin-type N-terminal cleavage/methylation domain-containing protein [Bacilli bacterium]
MIKRKSGFTLIELIAVIIILGIIMLIAFPVIGDLIDKSRMASYKNSMQGIIRSAEAEQSKKMAYGQLPKNIIYTYENGVVSVEPSDYKLSYNGKKPQEGKIFVNTKG